MNEKKLYVLVWVLCTITVSIAMIVSKSLSPLWALFIPALLPTFKVTIQNKNVDERVRIAEKLDEEQYVIEEKMDEIEMHLEEKIDQIREEIEEELDQLKTGFEDELDRIKDAFIQEMRSRYSERIKEKLAS